MRINFLPRDVENQLGVSLLHAACHNTYEKIGCKMIPRLLSGFHKPDKCVQNIGALYHSDEGTYLS